MPPAQPIDAERGVLGPVAGSQLPGSDAPELRWTRTATANASAAIPTTETMIRIASEKSVCGANQEITKLCSACAAMSG